MECFCYQSMRTKCLTCMHEIRTTQLPSYESVLVDMEEAEKRDGWLSECIDQSLYIALNRQFLKALSGFLFDLKYKKIVEICAGNGQLSDALLSHEHLITATDKYKQNNLVSSMSVEETLNEYKPDTVIGCFVPFDAGIDEMILADISVTNYVVVNARLNGQLGSPALWNDKHFFSEQVSSVSKWMICRHDVWIGTNKPLISHGEVWCFRRKQEKSNGSER